MLQETQQAQTGCRTLLSSSAIGLVMICAGLALPAAAQQQGPLQLPSASVEDDVEADKNVLNKAPVLSTLPTDSLQDTPQAVSVITEETMKQQATTTLGEALRNVPGITIAIGEGGTLAGDQFRIRGFDAKDDVYTDGLRDFAAYSRDSFAYQEVQVMKGPSGLMFGRGTTGGAINTVLKSPTLDTRISAHVEGGNGAHYRTTADGNYKIGENSAARIALMYTNTGVVDRDMVFSHRWGIAPSFVYGLDTNFVFNVSYVHQDSNGRPDYGQPITVTPTSIYAVPVTEYGVPRNIYLGYATDQDKNKADIVTARATWYAADWLTIENSARVAWYSRYFAYTTIDRCDNTAATNFCSAVVTGNNPTTALAGIGGQGPYQQDSTGWQDTLVANMAFDVGGFQNHLVIGGDISYQKADRTVYALTLPTTAQFNYLLGDRSRARTNIGFSLYNPVHTPPPGYGPVIATPANVAGTNATLTTVTSSVGEADNYAFFATDRFYFTPEVSLIAGVRLDRYVADYVSTTVAGVVTPAHSPSTLANPRASLVYEPDDKTTLYFSYGKSSVPQGTSVVGLPTAITTANQALAPEKSQNFEVGAKYSVLDGKLGLEGSIFQVKKNNATQTDPNSGLVILQSGQKQRVRGFEFAATGNVTEDLSILSAYTYLDPIITHDLTCGGTPVVCRPNPFTIGKMIFFVPRHAASLWVDYQLDKVVDGLSVGGGVVYQSALHNAITTTGTAPNLTGISRYAVIPETLQFDAVMSYQIRHYRLQLNVNNLTNRLNYSQSFGNRGTPAPGRTFIAGLDISF